MANLNAYKRLYKGQPSTSTAALYTVPGSTSAIVKHMRIVNPTSAYVSIDLYESGTADADRISPTVNIGPGEWAEWDGTITLAAASTIQAKASAATSLTVTIYGVEIS